MLKLIRNVSFVVFIMSFFILYNIKKIVNNFDNYIIPIIFFITIFTFSFIIINRLEIRWLGAVTIPSIFYYYYYIKSINFKNKNLFESLDSLNNIGFYLLGIYGVYRIYGFYLIYG